jgi:hypothetical protein
MFVIIKKYARNKFVNIKINTMKKYNYPGEAGCSTIAVRVGRYKLSKFLALGNVLLAHHPAGGMAMAKVAPKYEQIS